MVQTGGLPSKTSRSNMNTRVWGWGGRSQRRPVGRMNSCRRIVTICFARRLWRRGEGRGGGEEPLLDSWRQQQKGSVNYICLAAQPCPWSRSPSTPRKRAGGDASVPTSISGVTTSCSLARRVCVRHLAAEIIITMPVRVCAVGCVSSVGVCASLYLLKFKRM